MDKKINENLIRFMGQFPIDRQLETDDEIEITIKAGVVGHNERSNQDNSVNLTHLAKPIEIINLTVISN